MRGELDGNVYELEVAKNQMNDEHVLAAKDIVRMCEERGYHDLSQAIRIRYGLAEINYFDPKESKFVQACDAIGLHGCVQGHVHVGDETAIRYPIISVNGDIRKFDELYDFIKNNES